MHLYFIYGDLFLEIAPATCPAPPAIPNAESTVNGVHATYTCNKGYRIAGSTASITCTNAMWPTTGLPMCGMLCMCIDPLPI